MTIKYFIRDKGKGSYCESTEDDFTWINYGSNSIEVPKRPGDEYIWNGSKWARTEKTIKEKYAPLRIAELRRIDIYRLDPTLVASQIIERDLYSSSLMNLNFSDVENFKFPVCPSFMLD